MFVAGYVRFHRTLLILTASILIFASGAFPFCVPSAVLPASPETMRLRRAGRAGFVLKLLYQTNTRCRPSMFPAGEIRKVSDEIIPTR